MTIKDVLRVFPPLGPPPTPEQTARMRCVREMFGVYLRGTLDESIETLHRIPLELRDEDVAVWEAQASAFLSAIRKFRLCPAQRRRLFDLLVLAVTEEPMPTGPSTPAWIRYADRQLRRALPVSATDA